MDIDQDTTETVLLPAHRTALRAESLPPHLPVAAIRLHREVRRRMHELELAADHGRDPWLARELRRATAGLRELLAGHLPLHGTRCPLCRTRWGRAAPWPCHVWRTTHDLLDT
ncbi:MAG: hypothetical protein LH603_09550 [Pseudonocardia sp.]|nr:hypothetical protein [Pseudonocardia sp.]